MEAPTKNRIYHCHVKNAVKGPDHVVWSPVDKGFIDWQAQFTDLKAAGYHGLVSLETHWHDATTHEESTRISRSRQPCVNKRQGRRIVAKCKGCGLAETCTEWRSFCGLLEYSEARSEMRRAVEPSLSNELDRRSVPNRHSP